MLTEKVHLNIESLLTEKVNEIVEITQRETFKQSARYFSIKSPPLTDEALNTMYVGFCCYLEKEKQKNV